MDNAKCYFENLLFFGDDIMGGIYKKHLSKEVRETVEMCAQYVIYNLFHGREDINDYFKCELNECFEWNEEKIRELRAKLG